MIVIEKWKNLREQLRHHYLNSWSHYIHYMERMCVVGHGFALAMCRCACKRRSAACFEQQREGRVEEFQVQGGSRPYGRARKLDFVYILYPLAIFSLYINCDWGLQMWKSELVNCEVIVSSAMCGLLRVERSKRSRAAMTRGSTRFPAAWQRYRWIHQWTRCFPSKLNFFNFYLRKPHQDNILQLRKLLQICLPPNTDIGKSMWIFEHVLCFTLLCMY